MQLWFRLRHSGCRATAHAPLQELNWHNRRTVRVLGYAGQDVLGAGFQDLQFKHFPNIRMLGEFLRFSDPPPGRL